MITRASQIEFFVGLGWPCRSGYRISILLACFLGATAASAHPLHLSAAEADYNPATQKLEVALKVFPDDFEAALTHRAKKRISLERTPGPELDALIQSYLGETFTVKSRDGTPRPLLWVGRELKDGDAHLWLYFEVPLPDGVEGTRLAHLVLCDEFRDQLNSVLVRDPAVPGRARRQVTLVFFPDRAEKTVVFP
jgi:hypothetical protein